MSVLARCITFKRGDASRESRLAELQQLLDDIPKVGYLSPEVALDKCHQALGLMQLQGPLAALPPYLLTCNACSDSHVAQRVITAAVWRSRRPSSIPALPRGLRLSVTCVATSYSRDRSSAKGANTPLDVGGVHYQAFLMAFALGDRDEARVHIRRAWRAATLAW